MSTKKFVLPKTMRQYSWKQVKQIFDEALGQESRQRAEFIAKACGDNDNLRHEVESLLSSDGQAGSFLESPAIVDFPELKTSKRRVFSDGQHLNNYQIIKQIGSGGMGEVYLAEDTSLGRRVALKVLPVDLTADQERLRRFRQEAHAVSALNHPNILTIYEFGQDEFGTQFFASEFVEGTTLDKFCEDNKLALSKKIDITIQLASALGASHEAGVIHRDIKPDNVMIRPDGLVKVLDFGLAKLTESRKTIDSESEISTRFLVETNSRMVMGTAPYMSPEQARGMKTDERTDIWSLGVVLYEMLTGCRPFTGESATDTIISIVQDEPKPISEYVADLPRGLERIVSRALSKDPAGRYQAAKELKEDLQNINAPAGSGMKITGEEQGRLDTSEIEQIPTLLKEVPTDNDGGWHTISAEYIVSQIVNHKTGSLLVLAVLLSGFTGLLYWQPFRAVYEPLPHAKLSYETGKAAYYDGSLLVAKNNFEQAIDHDGNYVMAYARLAETLNELGFIDEARFTRESANEINHSNDLPLSHPDSIRLEAINNTLQLDFDAAAEKYRDLTEYAPEAEKAIAFFDLGRAMERNLNLSEALESYQTALTINPDFASANLRLGMLYGRQLEYEKAELFFSRAENIFKTQKRIEGEIEAINQRGLMHSGKGDATKAIESVKGAVDKAKINEIPYLQIKCLSLLSRVLRSDSKNDEAMPFAEEAVSIARRFDFKGQLAESLQELGTVRFFLGKYDDAEKTYVEALSIARQSNIKLIENRVLLQLGAFHVQSHDDDDADRALDYVNQVAGFFEKGRYEKDMLDVLRVRAQAYDSKGDFTTSLAIYKELVKRAEQAGNQFTKAWGKRGVGRIVANLDELRQALPELEESYSIFNSINQSFIAGYSLLSHADVALQLGDYQQAYVSLNLAEGIAQKQKQLIPRTNVMRARIAISERKFAEAIRVAEQVIAGDPAGKAASTFEAKTILALCYTYLGQKQKGLRLIEETFAGNVREDDLPTVSSAYLIRAEILLENGLSAKAKESAEKTQGFLKKLGKPSLEWRAWLFVSLADRKLNNTGSAKESAAKADAIFSTLAQKWNPKDFATYADRSDIKYYRKMLQESLTESPRSIIPK